MKPGVEPLKIDEVPAFFSNVFHGWNEFADRRPAKMGVKLLGMA